MCIGVHGMHSVLRPKLMVCTLMLAVCVPLLMLCCSLQGKLFATRVKTEPQLVQALQTALQEKQDHVCFIELIIDTHDCSPALLEFGARVSNANSRPPNPQ